jgi:undecaprenyl-diphosphatase
MQIWQSALLGIVEGITEFLPVSSTFHLLFTTRLLGIPENTFIDFFTVFIQAASILAVVALYFREWLKDWTLLKNVCISFIPTAVVGFVLHKVIKTVFFSSPLLMIVAFALTGVGFLILEVAIKKEKLKLQRTLEQISWQQAVAIGLFQAMAVLPGVSRAGAVMVVMMLMGYRRDEAAKYSFTLAIPTIIGAAVLDLIKTRSVLASAEMDQFIVLGVGCLFAFLSSLLIVRWFIQFLRGHSLKPFGVYRLVVATVLLLFGLGR